MSRSEQLLVWNILVSVAWCAVLVLSKMDHGKGLTALGVLMVLFLIFSMGASIASGVGVLLIWRDLTWLGRGFGFFVLFPCLVVIAEMIGWINGLPFGIRL